MTPIAHITRREFVFSLKFPSGATEALVIKAWSYEDAKSQIANIYPDATINWII